MEKMCSESKCELLSLAYSRSHRTTCTVSPLPPSSARLNPAAAFVSGLRPRTKAGCLVLVCLAHGGLLAAALDGSAAPAPAPLPAPATITSVTVQLTPPAPPLTDTVLSAPEPTPPPVPDAKPVSKPQPQQPPQPQSKPMPPEPDLLAAAPAEAGPPPEPVPALAVAEAAPVTSAPVFDADYLRNPAPLYPSLSRKRGEQGVVLLRVHVLADGTADQLEIVESSGFTRLDDAALRAVKRWQFDPAKQGEQAVAAWVRVPVRFDLTAASR